MPHKWTINEIRDTLAKAGERSIIFRPTTGGSFIELDYQLVIDALEELSIKTEIILSGLDEPSACDKLLTTLFIAHADYGI